MKQCSVWHLLLTNGWESTHAVDGLSKNKGILLLYFHSFYALFHSFSSPQKSIKSETKNIHVFVVIFGVQKVMTPELEINKDIRGQKGEIKKVEAEWQAAEAWYAGSKATSRCKACGIKPNVGIPFLYVKANG